MYFQNFNYIDYFLENVCSHARQFQIVEYYNIDIRKIDEYFR